MRILHYFLGFPPYRTGGLTKFAMDLMRVQVQDGHKVYALWPGEMKLIQKKSVIKRRKNIDGIENYELINPLPVSLDEGIIKIDAYIKQGEVSMYESFLNKLFPEVVHIHTFMGLHKEFIDATIKLRIKTIFTTHDSFPICSKLTLYKFGEACTKDYDCKDCVLCNKSALSISKIKIMQSPLYRYLKNSIIVKAVRKKHRSAFFIDEKKTNIEIVCLEEKAREYKKLREYYIGMLEKIDIIHFNSTVTEEIYKRYFTPQNSKRISITHANIEDHRKDIKWSSQKILRITCLAPAKPFKGFEVLRKALDEIWEAGQHDFRLNVYSPVNNPTEYMRIVEKGYNYFELKEIFDNTDILVAPSVCYETFGFTVLEALSYGVPVIVSNHVGAKDIVGNGGIIVEAGDSEQLKKTILSLDSKKIEYMRKVIKEENKIKNINDFVQEINQLYKF